MTPFITLVGMLFLEVCGVGGGGKCWYHLGIFQIPTFGVQLQVAAVMWFDQVGFRSQMSSNNYKGNQ